MSQYERLLESTAVSIAATQATLPAAERRLKEHLRQTVGFAKLESVVRSPERPFGVKPRVFVRSYNSLELQWGRTKNEAIIPLN